MVEKFLQSSDVIIRTQFYRTVTPLVLQRNKVLKVGAQTDSWEFPPHFDQSNTLPNDHSLCLLSGTMHTYHYPDPPIPHKHNTQSSAP